MYKIGIIGCGKIAKKHIDAIKANSSKFKLISVCDTNSKKARKLAKENNIVSYNNAEKMLQNESVDLVVLLTPHGNHLKDYQKLSKFKKNFKIEKPLALNSNDAKKINIISKNIKKDIFVVNQNRFNPPVNFLSKVYQKNILGNIFLGSAIIRWRRNQKYFNQAKWRGTKKLDGGVIGNQASHHLELLIHILGKVKEVNAMGSKFLAKKIETMDTIIVNLKFENNKFASIEATTATSPKDIEGSISFFGSKGSIIIGGFSMNKLKYFSYKLNNKIIDKIYKFKNKRSSHSFFYEYIFNNFKNKNLIKKNFNISIHVAEVIEAINKSVEKNKTFKIKEK